MFYAIAAAENLLVYGADVSNAFAEAPPPKQGFFIHPDRAFVATRNHPAYGKSMPMKFSTK